MSEQQFTPQEYIRIKVFPKVSSLAKKLKKLLYFWNRKTHAGFSFPYWEDSSKRWNDVNRTSKILGLLNETPFRHSFDV